MKENRVKPSNGKLGVMCVGLGAVTTTTIAGVLMSRKGLSKPIGSFACEGIMRLGKGSDKIYKEVKHIIPIADLNDIVFGAWDLYEDDAYDAAIKAGAPENCIQWIEVPSLEASSALISPNTLTLILFLLLRSIQFLRYLSRSFIR